MSQENVEIVRRVFLDPRPLTDAEHVAPNAVFDFTALLPDQPVLQGIEEMRAFRDRGAWSRSIHFEPEHYFDVDDGRVLVFVRVSATGLQSGVSVGTRMAYECRFRDGLIVHIKGHRDCSEALKAVGLEE
jgi:ketosteroid isomerase-like protein